MRNFIRRSLDIAFDYAYIKNSDWSCEDEIREFVLDFWTDYLLDLPKIPDAMTPDTIVENFLINDEWGLYSDYGYKVKDLERLKDEGEIVFYSGDYVIKNLRDYSKGNKIILGE